MEDLDVEVFQGINEGRYSRALESYNVNIYSCLFVVKSADPLLDMSLR